MNEKKSMAVYAISPEKKDKEGKLTRKEGEGVWREVGLAVWNKDESINVYLDAMPVTGRLQLRERMRKDEVAS